MIALPFHPSNVYTIEEVKNNPYEIFKAVEEDAKKLFGNTDIDFNLTDKIVDGKIIVDQGIIGGCAGGTYENVIAAAEILAGNDIGNDKFSLNIYPSSQPEYYELSKRGYLNKLMEAGANLKTSICGPCFGVGDIPANNALSIRHNTRNFPNREGSVPKDGQIASVALMDARSIAATAINKGVLTSAKEVRDLVSIEKIEREFNSKIYEKRVYSGFGNPHLEKEIVFAPSIKDWPVMIEMTDNLLLKVAASIKDPVTTTDELIPSGEASSFRSDPFKLAEFTLSKKDPEYRQRAKDIQRIEKERISDADNNKLTDNVKEVLSILGEGKAEELYKNTSLGSVIYAHKPGDGSAREQAASCQKVLGGWANIAKTYATKRYRSNCINWGMVPFITKEEDLQIDACEYVFIPGIKKALEGNDEEIKAYIISKDEKREITLYLENLSRTDRDILLSGCLINYYKK
jgi:aconitate hydratase